MPVYFGVTLRNTKSGRVEIHFHDIVHVTDNEEPDNETKFQSEGRDGTWSVFGNASEKTLEVVAALAEFTPRPYHNYLGIRLSASSIDGYSSRAVLQYRCDRPISELCAQLALIIGGEYAVAEVTALSTFGHTSAAETRDTSDYSLYDY